ncbi:hypothetical protein [Salinibaculum rarum]|uniref:EMC6-like membrane protein n=1 Tax=Salinibaculum rarum TaxID=3058903 RepID=UPI00265F5CA2|nr:hypothetical protein [Salinibaculum sp. KK48]
MATETGNGLSAHLRGVTVTTLATVLGMLAGVGSTLVATGPEDSVGVLLFGGAVLVQLPLLRVLGVDVSDFSTKDYLYIGFMTFVLWFITWGIMLTTGALQ